MFYPGFTLQEAFSTPVIPIPDFVNQTRVYELPDGQVEFVFNEYGYRSASFESVPQEHAVITGCSHTEGYGLPLEHTWAHRYQQLSGLPVMNLAKGSSNAEFCARNVSNWLQCHVPSIVIAQWPIPFRYTRWIDDTARFAINSSMNEDTIFPLMLKSSDNNFWQKWTMSILDLNHLCQQLNVPILNICLQTNDYIDQEVLNVLEQHNVELHLDMRTPEHSWIFDSGALDRQHHSAQCNEHWAQRIHNLSLARRAI